MSRHWIPDRRPGWTVIDIYRAESPKVHGRGALMALGAAVLGLAAGTGWDWWSRPAGPSGPSSAIEWNAVQAVPTRAPDSEDVEWQKRAEDDPTVIASPKGARQSSQEVAEGGLPRAAGTRNNVYVIDGDTFGIGGRHIRILGIDAPETHPPRCLEEARLGLAATEKLTALLASGTVTMSGVGHDKYGRELRQVFVNGVDVAQTMIAAGLARSYDGKQRQSWC